MPYFRTLIYCCGFLIAFALTASPADVTITIDGNVSGRTFEGLGAVSAGASSRLLIDYPEPYRSQILDYLFKPGYGAALQHLKVEIGADVNSTDGSEPSHMRSRDDHDYNRGYEWWLMKEAHRRNPKIILDSLPWGAPGWIGGGEFYSQDMANYVADFINGARKFHNLDIRYTGIWNERPYKQQYVTMLHETLLAQAISTLVVCCDSYHRDTQFEVIPAMQHDAQLRHSVAAVGVHYPRGNAADKYSTTSEAKSSAVPLWSSEDQPNDGGGPILSRDWGVGGRILAEVYNRNYLQGAFTKTEIWSPITSYFENLAAPHSGLMYANTPWSGHYEVQGAIWATAHTTQFAQPGWRYLDASSGFLPGNAGTYVSLKDPQHNDLSIVLETIKAQLSVSIDFKLVHISASTVHVWETNASKTFEHVADIPVHSDRFSYAVEPHSLYTFTTTTGQGRGDVRSPADHPFPLPYSEDFEKPTFNRTPKYLTDQDGAFEMQPCHQRPGTCLEQVITQKPIPWEPLPNPFTMTGDSNWSDYSVAVDALRISSDIVALIGRIDSADVFADGKAPWPSGYVFTVQKSGTWSLISTAYKQTTRTLVSGQMPASAGWRRLKLSFLGDQITVNIDTKKIAEVHDKAHRAGMFALGTEWGHAQFDNLKVDR
jgi:Glycosyl hydrolase family 59